MGINRYNIYLFLFFCLFLSADVMFIYMANKSYNNEITLDELNTIHTKNIQKSNDSNNFLSKYFEISIFHVYGSRYIIHLMPVRLNDIKKILIKITNNDDKKNSNIFVFTYFKQDVPYKMNVNLQTYSRCSVKVKTIDWNNASYYAEFRLFVNRKQSKFIQLT